MKRILILLFFCPLFSLGQTYTGDVFRAKTSIKSPLYFKGSDTLVSKLDSTTAVRHGSFTKYNLSRLNTAYGKTSSQWTTTGNDIYYSTGSVGVGVTIPGYKLDVNGDVNIATGSKYKINGTDLAASDVGAVSGTGTNGYISMFNGTSTLTNSIIQDNGTYVAIGTTPGTYKFQVDGTIYSSSSISSATTMRTSGITTISTSGANINIYPQDKDNPYIRFGAGNDNATFTTEWGRFIVGGNLGLGITAPTSKLHLDGGNATASYMQFTAGTTTGQLVTDGSIIGSNGSTDLIINNRENDSIKIYTNNTLAASLDASQNLTTTGTVITPASTTTKSGLRLPHGTAPSSPVNGDLWTTTTGLFSRINGTTREYANLDEFQTLSNKTLNRAKILDDGYDNSYTITPSDISADRMIILPLLTADDEFVFKNFTQTLTNKTLTSPTINTSIVSGSTSLDVFNTVATTVNFANSAGAALNIGNTGSNSPTHTYSGGATPNLGTKTINFGTGGLAGSITNINIGDNDGGTTTLHSPTIVGNNTTQNLFNTVATTMNFAGASTSFNLGSSATGASTYNLFNGGTTTGLTKAINIGTGGVSGSTTTIVLGSSTSTTNNLTFAGKTAGFIKTDANGLTSVDASTYSVSTHAHGSLQSGGTLASSGTMNFGSTSTRTFTFAGDATASGETKTLNFGTGGASGGITTINLGSSTAGSITNIVLNSNGVTTGNGISASNSTLTNGNMMSLTKTSTEGEASGSSRIYYATSSGANANASHSSIGYMAYLTNTGTTSRNVGFAASVSGATTNLAFEALSGQIKAAASTTSIASLNIPHGSAPSSPINGDVWTTTEGVYARINGATKTASFSGHTHTQSEITDLSVLTGKTASQITILGSESGNANVSNNNVIIGYHSGYSLESGTLANTIIGSEAMTSASTADYNIAIGYNAGVNSSTGDNNTFIGSYSGLSNTAGSSNVYIGYKAGYRTNLSNRLFIDNQDRTTAALDTTAALIYGRFNSTYTSQQLTFNSKVTTNGTFNYGADAGSTDTYTATIPGISAYATGMVIYFYANTANTGACTININSLGAKSLKSLHDQDPADNYIEAGSMVHAIYDGTNFQILSPDANP